MWRRFAILTSKCFLGYNLAQHRQIAIKQNQKHPKSLWSMSLKGVEKTQVIHILMTQTPIVFFYSVPVPQSNHLKSITLATFANLSSEAEVAAAFQMLGPWHGTWMNSVLNLLTRMQFAQRVCLKSFQGVDKRWLSTIPWTSWTLHSHAAYINTCKLTWHHLFPCSLADPFIDIFFLASRCYWGTKICSQSNNRPIASSGFGRPRALLASLFWCFPSSWLPTITLRCPNRRQLFLRWLRPQKQELHARFICQIFHDDFIGKLNTTILVRDLCIS